MATKEYTIKINGDVSGLEKSLREAQGSMEKIEKNKYKIKIDVDNLTNNLRSAIDKAIGGDEKLHLQFSYDIQESTLKKTREKIRDLMTVDDIIKTDNTSDRQNKLKETYAKWKSDLVEAYNRNASDKEMKTSFDNINSYLQILKENNIDVESSLRDLKSYTDVFDGYSFNPKKSGISDYLAEIDNLTKSSEVLETNLSNLKKLGVSNRGSDSFKSEADQVKESIESASSATSDMGNNIDKLGDKIESLGGKAEETSEKIKKVASDGTNSESRKTENHVDDLEEKQGKLASATSEANGSFKAGNISSEGKEMQEVADSANKAAEAKNKFAEANERVLQSVISSLSGIEKEANAFKELGNSVSVSSGKISDGLSDFENSTKSTSNVKENANTLKAQGKELKEILSSYKSAGRSMKDFYSLRAESQVGSISGSDLNAYNNMRIQQIDLSKRADQLKQTLSQEEQDIVSQAQKDFTSSLQKRYLSSVSDQIDKYVDKIEKAENKLRSNPGFAQGMNSKLESAKSELLGLNTEINSLINSTSSIADGKIDSITSSFASEVSMANSVLESSTSNVKENANALKALENEYNNAAKEFKDYYLLLSKSSPSISDISKRTAMKAQLSEMENRANSLRGISSSGDALIDSARNGFYSSIKDSYLDSISYEAKRTERVLQSTKAKIDNGKVAYSSSGMETISSVEEKLSKVDEIISSIRSNSNDMISTDDLRTVNSLLNECSSGIEKLDSNENKLATNQSLSKEIKQLEDFKASNPGISKEYVAEIDEIINKLKEAINTADDASQAFSRMTVADLKAETTKAINIESGIQGGAGGGGGSGFSNNLRSAIRNDTAQFFAQFFGFQDIIRYAQEIGQQVVSVDSALTELQKVSDVTDKRLSTAFDNAAKSAQKYGATVTDIINSTSDWARQGYGIKQSEQLAQMTQLFQNVGDNMTQETASEDLVSIIKGYGIDVNKKVSNGSGGKESTVQRTIDSINEVANHYAIDTEGIGNALKRSANSFKVSGTSLDKSIAILTAGNTTAQNPEKVGNAFKTITARIRGAKTELEDMGEDTENVAVSTSKLRDDVKALTGGFDIMKDKNTFKDMYEIIDGIGKAWNSGKMSDIQKQGLLEELAGKNQSNILAGVLNNVDIMEQAYNTATNAAGSADREEAAYEKSAQYRIDRLRASLQELSTNFLSSNILKGAIDTANQFLQIINKIVDKIGSLPSLLLSISGIDLVRGIAGGEGFFYNALKNSAGKDATDSLVKNAELAFSRIKKSFSEGVSETLSNTAKKTQQTAKDVAVNSYGSSKWWLAQKMQQGTESATKAKDVAVNTADTMSEKALSKAKEETSEASEKVTVSQEKETAAQVSDSAVNAEQAATESVTNIVKNEGSEVTTAAEGAEGALQKVVGTAKSVASTTGSVFEGLAKGMGSVVTTLSGGLITGIAAEITGGAILAVGAIAAVIAIYNKLTVSAKEAKEQLEDAQSKVSDDKSGLDDVNSQLSENKSTIKELQSQGTLSFVEKGQLEELQEANKELEYQKSIKEELLKQDQKELLNKANQSYNKSFKNLGNMPTNKELSETENNWLMSYKNNHHYQPFDLNIDSSDNLKTQLAGYQFYLDRKEAAQKNYENASSKSYKKQYKNEIEQWDKYLDDLKSSMSGELEDLLNMEQTYTSIPSSMMDSKSKKNLQSVRNAIDAVWSTTDRPSWENWKVGTIFDDLKINTGEFDNVTDYLADLGLKSQNGKFELSDLGDSAKDVKKALQDAGISVKDFTDNVNAQIEASGSAVDAIEQQAKAYAELSKNVQFFESVHQSATSALNESSGSTGLARDTYTNLKNSGYESAMEYGYNGVRINYAKYAQLEDRNNARTEYTAVGGDVEVAQRQVKAYDDAIAKIQNELKDSDSMTMDHVLELKKQMSELENKKQIELVNIENLKKAEVEINGLNSKASQFIDSFSEGNASDLSDTLASDAVTVMKDYKNGKTSTLSTRRFENLWNFTDNSGQTNKQIQDNYQEAVNKMKEFYDASTDSNGEIQNMDFNAGKFVKKIKSAEKTMNMVGQFITGDHQIDVNTSDIQNMANLWQVSESAVNGMLNALEDSGWNVNIKNTAKTMFEFKQNAQGAMDALNGSKQALAYLGNEHLKYTPKDFGDNLTDQQNGLAHQEAVIQQARVNALASNDGAATEQLNAAMAQTLLLEQQINRSAPTQHLMNQDPSKMSDDYKQLVGALQNLESAQEELDVANTMHDKYNIEIDTTAAQGKVETFKKSLADLIANNDTLKAKLQISPDTTSDEILQMLDNKDTVEQILAALNIDDSSYQEWLKESGQEQDIDGEVNLNTDSAVAKLDALHKMLLEMSYEQAVAQNPTTDENGKELAPGSDERNQVITARVRYVVASQDKPEDQTAAVEYMLKLQQNPEDRRAIVSYYLGIQEDPEQKKAIIDYYIGTQETPKKAQAELDYLASVDPSAVYQWEHSEEGKALIKKLQLDTSDFDQKWGQLYGADLPSIKLPVATDDQNVQDTINTLTNQNPQIPVNINANDNATPVVDGVKNDNVSDKNFNISQNGGETAKGMVDTIKNDTIPSKSFTITAEASQAINALASINNSIVKIPAKKTIEISVTGGGGAASLAAGQLAIAAGKGKGKFNGTAYAYGTAYASGNWGTKRREDHVLVGELGQELVVTPDGQYQTVGDRGAEFINSLPKGSIIFNHKQTEQILKNGHVTADGGRGKMKAYASGTAYASGNSSSSSSKSSSTDQTDFVSIMLDRIKSTYELQKSLADFYDTFQDSNYAIEQAISTAKQQISAEQQAKSYYLQKANSLGLSADYVKKIQEGALDIENISDENLKNLVSQYQRLYEKAIACDKEVVILNSDIKKMAGEKFDNIISTYKTFLDASESLHDLAEANNKLYKERNGVESWKEISEEIVHTNEHIERYRGEIADLQFEEKKQLANGTMKMWSKQWYEAEKKINDEKKNLVNSLEEYEEELNSIREINWTGFNNAIADLEHFNKSLSSAYDLVSDLDAWNDDASITSNGITQLGLLTSQMKNARQQVADYDTAIKALSEEYSKGVINQQEYHDQLIKQHESQQDAVKSVNEYRQSIIKLINEGIEQETTAFQKLVSARKEDLSAQKDADDYARSVQEKTKAINKTKAQIAAMSGDVTASGQAKLKQLQETLKEAEDALADTRRSHDYDTISDAYDKAQTKFEDTQDKRKKQLSSDLDAQNRAIEDALNQAREKYQTTYDELDALAKEYGVTFESEVVDPWKKAENAVVEYKDAIKKAMSDTSIETNNYPGKSGSTRFTNTGESMSSVVNADTRTALSQWSPVFSASYYAEHNPDVVAAVGYDEGKLLNHFLTYGQKEGRKGNDVFDVASYALANPDLVKAFGGDLAKYYQHYIQFGKGENRKTADKDAFNAKVYADRYPDLKKAFGYNYDKLLSHYLQYGIKEGRIAHARTGAKSISGLTLTDEDGLGSEVIITKDGVLRQLQAGSTVLNAEQVKRLWELSQLPIQDLGKSGAALSNTNAIREANISINNSYGSLLTVNGNVDKDALPSLKEILQQSYEYTTAQQKKNFRKIGVSNLIG